MAHGTLTADEINALDVMVDSAPFPTSFTNQRRPPISVEALVTGTEELTEEDAEIAATFVESGETLGVKNNPILTIRHTHHRAAQLLAVGTDELIVAKLCNYSPSYVSVLKGDPAFIELLAFYSDNVVEEWQDFVSAAAGLSMDLLQELQARLNENPKDFSITQMRETMRDLADRTGHAPVQKSVQVNINADAASRLARARARVREVTAEGQPNAEG